MTTPTEAEPGAAAHNIFLIATSPRLPAGLLTAAAWKLVKTHPVFAPESNETVEALGAAGVEVSIVDESDATRADTLLRAAGGGNVVWLLDPSANVQGFARTLASATISRPSRPTIEMVYGSWDPPGARLLDVVAVLDRLRAPGGCPWDAEQDHRSLMPYLLEEAYEAYDALDSGDRTAMIEELGDVLLQTVFHARLGTELPDDERWSIDDVAGALVEKLVNRHPHVFGSVEVSGAAEVHRNWEEIKRAEKKRESILDGVARSQPALSLAAKYLDKVEKFGLDVPAPAQIVEVPDDDEDLGDLLFSIVHQAREAGLDAEAALRTAADRYAGRVRAAEAEASTAAN